MALGNFSVSLAVKDIEASKLFYEKLGFTVFGGNQSQNWLIVKNGDHNINTYRRRNEDEDHSVYLYCDDSAYRGGPGSGRCRRAQAPPGHLAADGCGSERESIR